TYIFTFYYRYLTRPNPLPGPLPLPFIENHHNLNDVKLFYEQCQQKYGDLCKIVFNGHRCIDELGFYGRGTIFNNDYKKTDFSAWFHGFANDIVLIVTTGERVYAIASYYNTQSVIKSEYPDALVKNGNKFAKASMKLVIDALFFLLVGPFMRHYVPIIRKFSISMLKNRDYVFERFDMIIKNRRKIIDELPLDTEMKSDMLTSLITANTSRNTIHVKRIDGEMLKPMTDEQVRTNLIEAILGGTDTYTRYTSEEYETAEYKWPAGTLFHLNFLAVNKHPEFWPNSEIFDPDRFYDDNKYDKKSNDKNLAMFGGGQRIYPDRKLAMTELLLLIVLVFKNYNVELMNKNEPLKVKAGLTINCEELKLELVLKFDLLGSF
ncbi:7822_t:CDS:2, partial [Cetraspora pellucida]